MPIISIASNYITIERMVEKEEIEVGEEGEEGEEEGGKEGEGVERRTHHDRL